MKLWLITTSSIGGTFSARSSLLARRVLRPHNVADRRAALDRPGSRLLQKNNLNVDLLYIPGGSVIIQSIMSGDVKIANIAPPSAIGAWGNFRMVETFDHR